MRERDPEIRRETIGELLQTRKELMEGHAFVTVNDLGVLDVLTVTRAVELRLTLSGLLGDAVGFLQYAGVMEEGPILDSFKNQLCNAILAGIRAGYAMKFMTTRCDYYLKRRRLDAVRANLFY